MANFTPIATGAPADAAVVNAPLYELDSAITYLQSIGSLTATRPWAAIGGATQPTSSDNVPITVDIGHLGRMVRGATIITSVSCDFENLGNFANGNGNHYFSGTGGSAFGSNCLANNYSLAVGQATQASGDTSFAFGIDCSAAAAFSIALGGQASVDAGSTASAVLGGNANAISNASIYSGIVSGEFNKLIATNQGFIGAGNRNQIVGSSHHSGILAGASNLVSGGANNAIIGSGTSNSVAATNAMIGAGESNQVTGPQSFIGGGYFNRVVIGANCAILVGYENYIGQADLAIQPFHSLIAGGHKNQILDSIGSFIGAGETNTISQQSNWAAIMCGALNTVTLTSAYSSVVAGDHNTIAQAHSCFIGCGTGNTISNVSVRSSAIIGGDYSTVTGAYSTVACGTYNTISGKFSLSGGVYISLTHDNTFMWNSSSFSTFTSAAAGEFAVTAYGGVRVFTNTTRTTGMTMAAGTSSWSAVSSATLKGNFAPVEQTSILDRLLSVPIQTYNFKDGAGGYHDTVNLGPTAEDWDAAFADLLGAKTIAIDDKQIPAISDGDKLGVALAAIQGLTKLVYELQAKLN